MSNLSVIQLFCNTILINFGQHFLMQFEIRKDFHVKIKTLLNYNL